MKFYLFYFCFLTSFLYSQDKAVDNQLKITYEYNSIYSPYGNYETYLYINDTLSQYIDVRKGGVFTTNQNYRMTVPFLKFINNFHLQKQIVQENRILKDSVKLYAQWKNDIVWEITDKEKTIGNYKVRMAITDSFEVDSSDSYYYGKAIAWFTTDIPISSGPARYYGLPGLIIELEYQKVNIKYSLKNIEHKSVSDFKFIELNKDNEVEKLDVIYFNHKNLKAIKEIQKSKKKKQHTN